MDEEGLGRSSSGAGFDAWSQPSARGGEPADVVDELGRRLLAAVGVLVQSEGLTHANRHRVVELICNLQLQIGSEAGAEATPLAAQTIGYAPGGAAEAAEAEERFQGQDEQEGQREEEEEEALPEEGSGMGMAGAHQHTPSSP